MFAWATTFPWDGSGSTRGIVILLDLVPHLRLLDTLYAFLIQFLYFGRGVGHVSDLRAGVEHEGGVGGTRSSETVYLSIPIGWRRLVRAAIPVGGIGGCIVGGDTGAGAGSAGSERGVDPRQSGDARGASGAALALQTRAVQIGEKRGILHEQH